MALGTHIKFFNEPMYPLLNLLEFITPPLSKNAILMNFINQIIIVRGFIRKICLFISAL
jgi:hypothetical protein